MSFADFLDFLRGPGINAAIGFALSFGAEYIPHFEDLAPKYKRLLILALSFVIPLAATLAGFFAGYYEGGFEGAVWPALVAGATAFGASTMAHTRSLPGRAE